MERLQRLRSISLTEPLGRRPGRRVLRRLLDRSDGLKAILRAALRRAQSPGMFLIYGPPGSRRHGGSLMVVLEEALEVTPSPFFTAGSKVCGSWTPPPPGFIDLGIADPLIGRFLTPFTSGRAFGMAGIPQPNHRAVTKGPTGDPLY